MTELYFKIFKNKYFNFQMKIQPSVLNRKLKNHLSNKKIFSQLLTLNKFNFQKKSGGSTYNKKLYDEKKITRKKLVHFE